jgi:hypothetical protein
MFFQNARAVVSAALVDGCVNWAASSASAICLAIESASSTGEVMVGDAVASVVPAGTGSRTFANPKSNTFTTPSGRTFTLTGFKSR